MKQATTASLWEKPGETAPPTLTHSGRFTKLDVDKLRGGYYTSSELARWLCDWAIRTADDLVLEPSCGDGVFLEASAERLEKPVLAPCKLVPQPRS